MVVFLLNREKVCILEVQELLQTIKIFNIYEYEANYIGRAPRNGR